MSLAYKESYLITWSWEEGVQAPALTWVSSHFLFPKFLGWSFRDQVSINCAWRPPHYQNCPSPSEFPGHRSLQPYWCPHHKVFGPLLLTCSLPAQLHTSKIPLHPCLSCLPTVSAVSQLFSSFGNSCPGFPPTFLFLLSFLWWLPIPSPYPSHSVWNCTILPGSLSPSLFFFFL